MKLLGIIVITLVLVGMALLTTRLWGQGQRYAPYETEFFKNPGITIVIPWEQNYFLEKNPNYVLWADVYRGNGSLILVKPWLDRNKMTRDLEKVPTPARPTLEELLKKFPNTRFVINVNDNSLDIHKQVLAVILNTESQKRVLIQSDYTSILVSMKELEPTLLFGSTPADITRLKSFQSMWILSAAPFKGDVFFAPLVYHNIPSINLEISEELRHRYKKVFLGPLVNKTEVTKALELKADGLFVEDPLLLTP